MTKELNHYAVIDYSATGEGRTVCLLITRAYPRKDDWEILPSSENGWEGKLKGDSKEIVAREMRERAGDYFSIGTEHLDREEFLRRYGDWVPDVVKNMSDKNHSYILQPGNILFFQEFHFNYS